MADAQMPEVRRKAGVMSAVLLGGSAVASLASVLLYARTLPTVPVAGVVLAAIIISSVIVAAGWLGRTIWLSGARWPAMVLAAWSFAKEVMPDFLYPNALPRIVYLLAMSAAITALVRSRRAIA